MNAITPRATTTPTPAWIQAFEAKVREHAARTPGAAGWMLLFSEAWAEDARTLVLAGYVEAAAAFTLAASRAGNLAQSLAAVEATRHPGTPAASRAVLRGELLDLARLAAKHLTPCLLLAEWLDSLGWGTAPDCNEPCTAHSLATIAKLSGKEADLLHAASWGLDRVSLPDHPAGALLRSAATFMRARS